MRPYQTVKKAKLKKNILPWNHAVYFICGIDGKREDGENKTTFFLKVTIIRLWKKEIKKNCCIQDSSLNLNVTLICLLNPLRKCTAHQRWGWQVLANVCLKKKKTAKKTPAKTTTAKSYCVDVIIRGQCSTVRLSIQGINILSRCLTV